MKFLVFLLPLLFLASCGDSQSVCNEKMRSIEQAEGGRPSAYQEYIFCEEQDGRDAVSELHWFVLRKTLREKVTSRLPVTVEKNETTE